MQSDVAIFTSATVTVERKVVIFGGWVQGWTLLGTGRITGVNPLDDGITWGEEVTAML